ncbi:unnamed protein product [Closterium sp. NIES-54]
MSRNRITGPAPTWLHHATPHHATPHHTTPHHPTPHQPDFSGLANLKDFPTLFLPTPTQHPRLSPHTTPPPQRCEQESHHEAHPTWRCHPHQFATLIKEIPPQPLHSSLLHSDVSINRITGPIPPGVATLTALTSLDVSYNQMTGALLPGLGNLRQLRTL